MIRYLLIGILSLCPAAYADDGRALVAVGGILGVTAGAAGGGVMTEMRDWKQPSTGSTVELAHECGLNTEWRLYNNNAYNLTVLIIQNPEDKSAQADVTHLRMKFDTGTDRLAVFPWPQMPVNVAPHAIAVAYPFFPSKDDFKNANRIEFELPVKSDGKSCTIHATITRPANVPRSQKSSNSTTSFEMSVGVGATLMSSNAIRSLGGAKEMFDLSFYGYPGIHKGIFLTAMIQNMKSNSTYMAPATGSESLDPKLTLNSITLGYSYRKHLFNPDFHFSTDLGLGYAGFQYSSINSNHESADGLSALLKLNFTYRFSRVREGRWRGDYSVGTSAYDLWIPHTSIKGLNASGQIVGALIYFKMGG